MSKVMKILLSASMIIRIMDDEEVVTDIASRMLKYIGFAEIVSAADGDEEMRL